MKIVYAVILTSFFCLTSILGWGQVEMDDKMAFHHFLKLNDSKKKDFTIEHMYQYNNKVYDKYWNDEFDFHEKTQVQYQEMEASVNAINLDAEYVIRTRSEFGNYNFDKGGFEFLPFDESSVSFEMKDDPSWYSCEMCKTLTEIKLVFRNLPIIDFLPVVSEKANVLIKERKKSSGKVDRYVSLKIHYTISDQFNDRVSDKKHKVEFYGTINKIEVLNYYNYGTDGNGEVISTLHFSPPSVKR